MVGFLVSNASSIVDRDFMTPLLSIKGSLIHLYSNAAQSSVDLLQYKGCHGLYMMAASRHFLAKDEASIRFSYSLYVPKLCFNHFNTTDIKRGQDPDADML